MTDGWSAVRGVMSKTVSAADKYAGKSKSAICIEPDAKTLTSGSYPRYLPDRTTVQYTLEHGEVEVDLREGRVRISCNGHGEMFVKPVVSNVVEIQMIEVIP